MFNYIHKTTHTIVGNVTLYQFLAPLSLQIFVFRKIKLASLYSNEDASLPLARLCNDVPLLRLTSFNRLRQSVNGGGGSEKNL